MFIGIDNGKYIAAINKKFICCFFYLDNTDDFRLTDNDIDTENNFENNNILQIFIDIVDDFLDLISSK